MEHKNCKTNLVTCEPQVDSAVPRSEFRAPHSLCSAAASSLRRAFTLVELLVAVSVIAILAGLLLGALYTAQDSARAQKTKSTIAKLHTMMMARYDSYKTRRVPIDVASRAVALGLTPSGQMPNPKVAAKIRLDGLRELMRMEMPDRFSDIIDNPVSGIPRPSLSQSYLRRITAAPAGYDNDHERAECLYMIITMGVDDEDIAIDKFGASEVGDKDGDGLREFHDAWGNTIRFLRWAPGFASELQTRDPLKQPDPFDPRKVYPHAGQTDVTFALYPLIYSAGPDGEFDIYGGSTGMQYSGMNNNPFVGLVAPHIYSEGQVGTTVDFPANGEQNWADNIHNHLIGTR